MLTGQKRLRAYSTGSQNKRSENARAHEQTLPLQQESEKLRHHPHHHRFKGRHGEKGRPEKNKGAAQAEKSAKEETTGHIKEHDKMIARTQEGSTTVMPAFPPPLRECISENVGPVS